MRPQYGHRKEIQMNMRDGQEALELSEQEQAQRDTANEDGFIRETVMTPRMRKTQAAPIRAQEGEVSIMKEKDADKNLLTKLSTASERDYEQQHNYVST
jgi:hypothetical protein